jgi:hypothetical protein
MGLWNFMTGSKPAPRGVAALSASALRESLMGINRKTAPFKVRSGASEGVDLVAEWKIVDAKWYSIFAKAGIKRVFKILMNLDEERHEAGPRTSRGKWNGKPGLPTSSCRPAPGVRASGG